jgi:hypothetical protein
MPQYAIHRSAISAALPGVSKLASAFAGGDEAYRAAQDKEALNQSRIAQLSGLQSQQEAQAEHFTAQAENERAKTDVLKSRPGFYEEQSAIASNVDIPTIRAFRAQVAGQSPQVPMGPPTEGGQMGIGSFQAGPETRSKISLALQQFLPMLINSGDLKPDDLAQAAKVYHDIGLQNEVMDGRRTAASVNEAQRAVKGSPVTARSSTQLLGRLIKRRQFPGQRYRLRLPRPQRRGRLLRLAESSPKRLTGTAWAFSAKS